jgi:hypothetical protein
MMDIDLMTCIFWRCMTLSAATVENFYTCIRCWIFVEDVASIS